MKNAATHLSTASNQRLEVIILAVICSGVIFELVRRKRLMERYALLWLLAGTTVLVLGVWKGLLTKLAHAAGIYYAPSALFAVAFLFVLALLIHFSITVSRLTDQTTVLAQKLALLQARLDRDPGGAHEPELELELVEPQAGPKPAAESPKAAHVATAGSRVGTAA